jgi:hypothetical protein
MLKLGLVTAEKKSSNQSAKRVDGLVEIVPLPLTN